MSQNDGQDCGREKEEQSAKDQAGNRFSVGLRYERRGLAGGPLGGRKRRAAPGADAAEVAQVGTTSTTKHFLFLCQMQGCAAVGTGGRGSEVNISCQGETVPVPAPGPLGESLAQAQVEMACIQIPFALKFRFC